MHLAATRRQCVFHFTSRAHIIYIYCIHILYYINITLYGGAVNLSSIYTHTKKTCFRFRRGVAHRRRRHRHRLVLAYKKQKLNSSIRYTIGDDILIIFLVCRSSSRLSHAQLMRFVDLALISRTARTPIIMN